MSEDKDTKTEPKPESKPAEEQRVETQHSVKINGKLVKYTAIAGTLVLKEEDDEKGEHKPKASVYYTAYIVEQAKDAKPRPLTFSFNGGPGSSSVWLHLGVLGPRRVDMPLDDSMPRPPFDLVDNEYSILAETDLVFIDPVTTGYSRPVAGEAAKQFHGFQKDLETVGEFIRLFTTRHQRWSSPKFLIGESYGTTRAAALSGHLLERHGMALNGIMLISSVLEFSTLIFNAGNDLPYILFLPTYAATAWYHKQLSPELQKDLNKTLAEVRSFAAGEYAAALFQGDSLPAEQRQEVAAKLAAYTGLSQEYVERTNLRVEIHRFTKELLRGERKTVGRLDSRFIASDRDSAGENYEFDPSYAAIQAAFTAALNQYVRAELEFESDLPYEILTGRVHPWSYKENENQYLNVAETLRQAMVINPAMQIFVANGYYDLATPFFATEYTFNHLQLAPELRGNISMEYYEAGHMMYIHEASLKAQFKHLVDFIQKSL